MASRQACGTGCPSAGAICANPWRTACGAVGARSPPHGPAAFALRNDLADVWLTMLFGVLGFVMRRYGLPVPALVMGVILGPLAEQYFLTSMVSHGNDWTVFLTRPISAALLRTLACVTQIAPTFSLRGGTREILRGVIARGLGLR